MFQVGGDDVIAVGEDALEGHVEGVGAVEREDEAFRLLAVEELVEQMAAVVEGVFGGEGHLVAGPAGVGKVMPREAIEGLVDGFGFGETGGGVVEVDHDGCSLGRSSRSRTITDGRGVERFQPRNDASRPNRTSAICGTVPIGGSRALYPRREVGHVAPGQ